MLFVGMLAAMLLAATVAVFWAANWQTAAKIQAAEIERALANERHATELAAQRAASAIKSAEERKRADDDLGHFYTELRNNSRNRRSDARTSGDP